MMNVSSAASLASAEQRRRTFHGNAHASDGLFTTMPLVLSFEANWRIRAVLLRGLGVAMMLSASGLWLFTGSNVDPELNLMKVGVSVLLFVLGVALATLSTPGNQPEACFDPVRRELRVLRRDSHGRPKTVLRRSYDTIAGARLSKRAVQLFESDGSLLIEVPLGSVTAHSQLRDQLRGAVQLFG